MARFRSASLPPFVVAVLAATALFAPSREVASQQKPGAAAPAPVQTRVAELERRVDEMQRRLEALDRLRPVVRANGSYEVTLGETTFVIAADGRVFPAAPAVAAAPAATNVCDPPFHVLPTGARAVKPECAWMRPCDPPFHVDSMGIRRIKPECL